MDNTIQQKNSVAERHSEMGFTIAEMVVVMVIIGIISAFTVASLTTQKMHEADTQTLLIIDILQEARQRALSQRTTMRVEINATLAAVRLIDERTPGNAADDVVIKTSRYMGNGVYIGSKPTNVTNQPTEMSPVPVPTFATSNHPLSTGNSVLVLRFLRNGNVANAGTNAIGAGATPTGSTIYVWSKFVKDNSTTPTNAQVMRAITVLASSGSTKMWKCFFTNGTCSNWTK